MLQLFCNRAQLDRVAVNTSVFHQFRMSYTMLDADGWVGAELDLARIRERITCGLHLPND